VRVEKGDGKEALENECLSKRYSIGSY